MGDPALAREALRLALRTRRRVGLGDDVPVDVWDATAKLSVPVRFHDESSMEGLYTRSPSPLILVSSERPPGRQAFTCAHELGHHLLGHGGSVDAVMASDAEASDGSPEEALADAFAGYFLMPPRVVARALEARSIVAAALTPSQAYSVSEYLGVSYVGFLIHAWRNLGLLPGHRARGLLDMSLPDIRESVLGRPVRERVVPVDRNWTGRAIDLRIGDLAALPENTIIEGNVVVAGGDGHRRQVVRASRVGIGRAVAPGWAAFIRVCRPDFKGLAKCRYWPEVDDD